MRIASNRWPWCIVVTRLLASAAPAHAQTDAAEIDHPADDAPHCSATGIEGVVRDAMTGETLIEAPVVVVGRRERALTDYDGRFAIDLPPGTYSVRAHYDLYQPQRLDEVLVRRGECTHLEIALEPEASAAEEVVIEVRAEAGSAASQLRERREASTVQDAISREEMRRAPDATASEAARRIVGVAMRDDYVFVRGLGGRYVVALMNGIALPQTDPDVPGVQLDVLPTGLLESITVRKTFTAELPGDWAGGLVDVDTASYPERFELRAGATFGLNTRTSFQSLLGSRGGTLDWLGWDDGTRSFPASTDGVDVGSLPDAERDAISLQFPNTWAMRTRTGLPNLGVHLGIGDTIDVGGRRIGYRLTTSYRIAERPVADLVQTLRQEYEGAAPTVRETLTQMGSERTVQLGALGTSTVELDPGHDLTLNLLFSQNADEFHGRQTGYSETRAAEIDSFRIAWIQRTLFVAQILGAHRSLFGTAARFDWQMHASYGERRQPDMRDMLYVREDDGRYRYTVDPQSGNRFGSDLDDMTLGGGLGATIPLDRVTLRAGGLYRRTNRDLRIRRFGWFTRPRAPADGVYLSPSQLFAPENLNTYLRLQDRTAATDGYDATQELFAAYASVEWSPWNALRIVAGIRGESFRQTLTTIHPTGGEAPQERVRRTDVDPLPSAAAILELTDGVLLRASYGGTVGRPQIRELAPFAFADFLRRRTVTGQPDLRRTYVHDFDLRLEWFPSPGEVLAISGFVKLFEAPIEQVINSAEGDASFANVSGAETFGVEAEARVHLGQLARELSGITVSANLTLTHSRARLSLEEVMQATNLERPMAGQAPFVVNVALGWCPPGTGLSFHVFYNVLGPRLEDVGRRPFDDAYRQPFHALDLSAAWEPMAGFTLRLSAQNLLLQRQDLTQSGVVVQSIDPGTQISLGASVSR